MQYPFTDLSQTKVRPAVAIHAPHPSADLIVVPLTSRTSGLLDGEFVLTDWASAGLNVATAVKRGVLALHPRLVLKKIGNLTAADASRLDDSLRRWLGL